MAMASMQTTNNTATDFSQQKRAFTTMSWRRQVEPPNKLVMSDGGSQLGIFNPIKHIMRG